MALLTPASIRQWLVRYRSLVAGAISAILGRWLSVGGIFLLTVSGARMLPASEFGRFSIALSFSVICGLLAPLGSDFLVLRSVARASKRTAPTEPTFALGALTLLVLMSTAILAVAALLLIGHLIDLVWFVGTGWGLCVGVRRYASALLRAQGKFTSSNIFAGGTSLIGGLAIIWVQHRLAPSTAGTTLQWVSTFIISEAALAALALGLALAPYRGQLMRAAVWARPRRLVSMCRISLPLMVWSVASQLREMSAWVLGVVTFSANVAHFSVAYRVAQFVFLPSIVSSGILMPLLARGYQREDSEEVAAVRLGSVGIAVACTLIFAVVFIGGPHVFSFVFGKGFAGSFQLAVIIALGQVGMAWLGLADQGLAVVGKHDAALTVTLIVGVGGLAVAALAVRETGSLVVFASILAAANFLRCLVSSTILRRRLNFSVSPAVWIVDRARTLIVR